MTESSAPRVGPSDAADISPWPQVGAIITAFNRALPDEPVVPPADPELLTRELASFDFASPAPLAVVIDRVAGLLHRHAVHVTHPRYFGLFNPGVRTAGVVGETLAAAFNPQLAVWSHNPAANAIEQHTLRQFTRLLGFPVPSTMAHFTAGGAEANLSALAVALAHHCPRWAEGGIAAVGQRPRIYLSADAHDSFIKAVRVCGLGTDAARRVPAPGPRYTMDPVVLERLIMEDRARGDLPLLVVATAGTTSTGAIDPLTDVTAVARRQELWCHVDAAWGGSALMSPRLGALLAGIADADSVTWDAHKWLSVPFSAGMFFCRHPSAIRNAFAVPASYMPIASDDHPDPFATSLQWGRRAIGLKVFMSLAELGMSGYQEIIEHQAVMGDLVRLRLREAGFLVVNETTLPVICFTHPSLRGNQGARDAVLRALQARGRVWISGVAPDGGEPLLRACITHADTGPSDIEELVEELRRALPGQSGDRE